MLIPFAPYVTTKYFEIAMQTTDPTIALKNRALICRIAVITPLRSQMYAIPIAVKMVGTRR